MDKSTDALATVCSLHTPLLGSSVSYLVEDVCVYMFSFQYIFHPLIFLMRIIYQTEFISFYSVWDKDSV